MLSEAHSIANHGRARADVDFGNAPDLFLLDAGHLDDARPFLSQDILADSLQSDCVLANEIVFNDFLAFGLSLEDHLHHALKEGEIAADSDVNEFARDRSRS